MKDIRAIFFDLDHTLWDFERNSGEALRETLHILNLIGRGGLQEDDFIDRYHVINDRMWEEYRKGLIVKEDLRARRFDEALALYGIHEEGLGERFASTYLGLCPMKKHLFPHTEEVLSALVERYPLYLITNGFSEIQNIKIQNPAIGPYFKDMITSEAAGAKKPSPLIFDYAMQRTSQQAQYSIMIGDDIENDIRAALAAGMALGIWFNPAGKVNPYPSDERIIEIHSLKEILDIV